MSVGAPASTALVGGRPGLNIPPEHRSHNSDAAGKTVPRDTSIGTAQDSRSQYSLRIRALLLEAAG